jgi:hypothetical protein
MPMHCFGLLEFKSEFEFQLLVFLFKIFKKNLFHVSLSFSSFWLVSVEAQLALQLHSNPPQPCNPSFGSPALLHILLCQAPHRLPAW